MESLNFELVTYVKLVKTLTPNIEDENIQFPSGLAACRLLIEAFDAEDENESVFVFQVEAFDPDNENSENVYDAKFTNVCSPNDMEELIVGIPDDDSILFRYHKIDVLCRSLAEADFIWQAVKDDVQALVDHNKLLESPTVGSTSSEEYVAE